MALIDLATYKSLTGVDPTYTTDDVQIAAILEGASQAVEAFTGRTFVVSTGVSTPRTYQYDGSGFLDIDDCTAVTGIEINIPNAPNYVMQTAEWTAMPDNGVVFYYVILHGGPNVFGISPQMGFTYNLDRYDGFPSVKPSTVSVTATWGWPAIPDAVKLAVALTVSEFVSASSSGRGEGLTAEAIADWSRSWGTRTGGSVALAIPNRARDLLAPFTRLFA